MIDLFLITFRNITHRKKRSLLTLVGIFIGIAAVVAMVSLGHGLTHTINEQFEKVGADKIIVQVKELGFTGGQGMSSQLTIAEKKLINKVSGVKLAAGMIFSAKTVVYNNLQRTNFIISIPPKPDEAELIIKTSTLEVDEGRLISYKDKNKVMIGHKLAHGNYFKKNIPVGAKVLIGNKEFKVVGLLKRTGDPGFDSSFVMSEADAREIFDNEDKYGWIIAQADKGENPEIVAERIEKKLRKYRHLKKGKEDFTVQTSTEMIASFNVVLSIVQAIFIGIASISLVVGGVGIMNTMFTSVLERTRDIGIMKAIGARNQDILFIFLLESGFLGLVGGIIGIVLGVSLSKLVEIIATKAIGPVLKAYFPWYLILGALMFSFIVGCLSGLLPAKRASRLNPVDALRYE
ncbi:hypothetical protein DRJ22_03435 [Candidatus Woesearchaeota archaeon]|nr:MAG: hypothetical protein DRJ22_03435 [Candidatus Woesearchaeota archaeon]